MTATHHLDHLGLLQHARLGVPDAVLSPGSSPGVLPTSAETTHFAVDGSTVAATSTTDYAEVTLDPAGGAGGGGLGGVLHHAASTADGKPLNTSRLEFGPGGTPATSTTTVHNRFAEGDFVSVAVDFAQVAWTPQMQVASGAVGLTLVHPGSGRTRLRGRLSFAGERVTTGVYNHHDRITGEVRAQSRVDYSGAEFVGSRIVGGQCALEYLDQHRRLTSSSTMHFGSAGTLDRVETTNHHPETGAATSQVVTDFAGAQFDARHQVRSGQVQITASTPGGDVTARTVTEFRDAVPASTTIDTTSKGAAMRLVTDFAGARFDNDLKAISSEVPTRLYDDQGRLVAVVTVTYDAEGQRTVKTRDTLDPVTGATLATVRTDYADARLDARRRHVDGTLHTEHTDHTTGEVRTASSEPPASPVASVSPEAWEQDIAVPPLAASPDGYHTDVSEDRDAQGELTGRTETITRADSTLLAVTRIEVSAQRPTSGTVTRYALDGTTVTATDVLDLSELAFDDQAHTASGRLSVRSLFGGSVPSASSTVHF